MDSIPQDRILRITNRGRLRMLSADLESVVDPGAATEVCQNRILEGVLDPFAYITFVDGKPAQDSAASLEVEKVIHEPKGNFEASGKTDSSSGVGISDPPMDLNTSCSDMAEAIHIDDEYVSHVASSKGGEDVIVDDLLHSSSPKATASPQNSLGVPERNSGFTEDPLVTTPFSKVELLKMQLKNSSARFGESEARAAAASKYAEEMESRLKNIEVALRDHKLQLVDLTKMLNSHWEMLGALESRLRVLEPLEVPPPGPEVHSEGICKEKRQKTSHQGGSPSRRFSKTRTQMDDVLLSTERVAVDKFVKVLWDEGIVSREQLRSPVIRSWVGSCSWLDSPSPEDSSPPL